MRTFAAGIGAEGNFIYFNRRPDGKHLQDCVCRAISTATGISYDAVNRLLELTAEKYSCDKLCVCCYHNLLEGILKFPRFNCTKGETVRDIAAAYPNNTLLIRIQGHLTCAVNGYVHDIWDCTGESVDCFWITK